MDIDDKINNQRGGGLNEGNIFSVMPCHCRIKII